MNRTLETIARFVLDDLTPPRLRDSHLFMGWMFRLLFKGKAEAFMGFKERAPMMSARDIQAFYADVAHLRICHEASDLSPATMDRIEGAIVGASVLEAGCGDGVLAGRLAHHWQVTACDFVILPDVKQRFPGVRFDAADIAHLPYPDAAFDTVTCTHVLEHLQDFDSALKELRRVARRRLIVVLPRERPYRYAFNLHLHFFPYRHSVLARVLRKPDQSGWFCDDIDGAWYYQEDLEHGPA